MAGSTPPRSGKGPVLHPMVPAAPGSLSSPSGPCRALFACPRPRSAAACPRCFGPGPSFALLSVIVQRERPIKELFFLIFLCPPFAQLNCASSISRDWILVTVYSRMQGYHAIRIYSSSLISLCSFPKWLCILAHLAAASPLYYRDAQGPSKTIEAASFVYTM